MGDGSHIYMDAFDTYILYIYIHAHTHTYTYILYMCSLVFPATVILAPGKIFGEFPAILGRDPRCGMGAARNGQDLGNRRNQQHSGRHKPWNLTIKKNMGNVL